MAPSRKMKKRPVSAEKPQLDALPRNAGYLLSIGPAILWLDRPMAEEILTLLAGALKREDERNRGATAGNGDESDAN